MKTIKLGTLSKIQTKTNETKKRKKREKGIQGRTLKMKNRIMWRR